MTATEKAVFWDIALNQDEETLIRLRDNLLDWPTSAEDLLIDAQVKELSVKLRRLEFRYDVAFSYSGRDREHVERLAEACRAAGLRVFPEDFSGVDA